MLKVKHERDCDCVVAGFRWHKKGERTAVGSLLLGLFDDSGTLQHVGVCASFTEEKRRELAEFLAPYRRERARRSPLESIGPSMDPTGEAGHRMPGGQSRWSQGKDLSWEPLRPELVVEVAYDHMQGNRFRHTGALSPVAHRQEAVRLHLCPARSRSAARTGCDFRHAADCCAASFMFRLSVKVRVESAMNSQSDPLPAKPALSSRLRDFA